MFEIFRHWLKDHLLILKVRSRFNPAVQISQRQMFLSYQDCAKRGDLPELKNTGFKVFSQFEEDGLLLYIFSIIGMENKTFVEIGSDDGVNSNSANLYFNFGWHGLFIDANKRSVQRGRKFFAKYPHPWFFAPQFVCAKVTRENINALISKAGYNGEVALLSIDIDGNDYWIWDAITVIDPKVVIIETHNNFGMRNIVVPYDPEYVYPGKHDLYHGASPVAMTRLAKRKGYRLVGANDLGFNFIFLKNGTADVYIPEVEVESVLGHPSLNEMNERFEEIRNWKFEDG